MCDTKRADDDGTTAPSKKRMCILGGGGYLGQLLAASLQRDGHFCVLLDLQFAQLSHIRLVPELCTRISGSILDEEHLRKALTGCDACFHLAGYGMCGGASVSKQSKRRFYLSIGKLEREKCMAVNVEGTRRVLAECERMGVRRLVFTSSVSVIFDGQNELHMADEESTPYVERFANPYVESKCAAEKLVLAANRSPFLSTCALRLRGIYGPGELKTVKRSAALCQTGIVKCIFRKSVEPKTQYSGANNSVQALILAEKCLRREHSPAAGKKYHILDDGPPVDPFGFWFPMIAGIGCAVPRVRIPYALALWVGFLFEQLYTWSGVEPLFTRYEVSLMGVTNTFSIERAKRDLGYAPVCNHQLDATTAFLQREMREEAEKRKCTRNSRLLSLSVGKFSVGGLLALGSILSPSFGQLLLLLLCALLLLMLAGGGFLSCLLT